VGYGYKFTSSLNLGHQNNQIFSFIPYYKLLQKLDFQCRKSGIKFIKLDESYTSKASFFDNDYIPDKLSRAKYQFSGKRRYRGLYISKDGIKINADLNAALNILSQFANKCMPVC